MINHKFNLGDKLKDSVTGYSGVVVGITKYATGCIHYGLQSDRTKENKPQEWEWFDESRMSLVKKQAVKFNLEKPVSGNFPNAPNH
jgi:hypothetical protein